MVKHYRAFITNTIIHHVLLTYTYDEEVELFTNSERMINFMIDLLAGAYE